MDDLVATKVRPFYLQMMGLNATSVEPARLDAIRAAASSVTLEQVVRLLRDTWRERVMGAWYSLSFSQQEVGDALAQSVRTSAGSLTAPALATAAVALLGPAAVPALRAYTEHAPADGSSDFVAAALEHVGAVPAVLPEQRHRDDLTAMLAVAHVLRSPGTSATVSSAEAP